MTLVVGSLCSGYEATGLGLHLAGWDHRLAFVADPDPAASKALAHHHPDIPNLGDITTVDWAAVARVDLLHMGFPCTDLSCAGRRQGLAAHTRSGVWAHCARAIEALQPPLVLIENVPGLLSTPANRSTDADLELGTPSLGNGPDRPVLRAIGAVLGDLADLGFDAVWIGVSAASVGAPHRRNRIFILAWPVANPPCFRHRNLRQAGIGGVPSAAVAGGTGADGLTLLPTPTAHDDGKSPEAHMAMKARLPGGPRQTITSLSVLARADFQQPDALLPTPSARDWKSGESNIMDRNARPLNEVIVNLLPTPRATDGTKGGPNQRGSSGDLMLPSAVMLLPTPTAKCANDSQTHRSGTRSDELLLTGVAKSIAEGALLITPSASDAGRAGEPEWAERWAGGETIPETHQRLRTQVLMQNTDRWGEYAPAIARWESVVGRPAPDPTEPGSKGQPRLSAAFVEWLQGLPAGYVTAIPGITRNDALRLLGNSNPPQQYAAAITQLAAITARLLAAEVT